MLVKNRKNEALLVAEKQEDYSKEGCDNADGKHKPVAISHAGFDGCVFVVVGVIKYHYAVPCRVSLQILAGQFL